MLRNIKNNYLCIMFFMVLDLRLRKIGCRETTFFFYSTFAPSFISFNPSVLL